MRNERFPLLQGDVYNEIGSTVVRVRGLGRISVRTETTGPYTAADGDTLIIGDTTAGSFSVLLPAAPTTGQTFMVKKSVAANTLTIDGNGKNIDGAATVAITARYTSYTVVYNGTEWSIV